MTKLDEPTAHLAHRIMSRRRLTLILSLIAVIVISLMVSAVFAWYLSTGKPLAELPGLTKERMPNYAFSIYGPTRPSSVAVSPAGDRVYVVEGDGLRRVIVYNPSGEKIGLLNPPQSTGTSHGPVYVAVNPRTSDVFVSDRLKQAVYVYDATGSYKETFTPKGVLDAGWQPLGLAFDQNGLLYVSDVSGRSHRILVFNVTDGLVRTIGTWDGLLFPNGLAVDSRGAVYVSDSNNGRLVIFDLAGKNVATINRGVGEGDLGMPRGLAIDDSDRLYTVDTANHMVKIYHIGAGKSPAPKYIGSFGEEGQVDGTFEYPNGVAIDSRSRIYVTDRENNRVQVWSY